MGTECKDTWKGKSCALAHTEVLRMPDLLLLESGGNNANTCSAKKIFGTVRGSRIPDGEKED